MNRLIDLPEGTYKADLVTKGSYLFVRTDLDTYKVSKPSSIELLAEVAHLTITHSGSKGSIKNIEYIDSLAKEAVQDILTDYVQPEHTIYDTSSNWESSDAVVTITKQTKSNGTTLLWLSNDTVRTEQEFLQTFVVTEPTWIDDLPLLVWVAGVSNPILLTEYNRLLDYTPLTKEEAQHYGI